VINPPPSPNLAALRLALSRFRAERGYTYDELAARSGLARRTLIEIEQGRAVGTLKSWHALAHALGVPLCDLLGALCEGHEIAGASPREPGSS
jgi:putative transcriptional regulator